MPIDIAKSGRYWRVSCSNCQHYLGSFYQRGPGRKVVILDSKEFPVFCEPCYHQIHADAVQQLGEVMALKLAVSKTAGDKGETAAVVEECDA